MLDAFARLAPADRDVLALSLWFALPPDELAGVIDARDEEVQARLQRARNRLLDAMTSKRTP